MARGLLVVIVMLAASSPAQARKPRPRSGTELTTADLAWPASTRSARTNGAAEVLRVVGESRRFGKLAPGTRVAWKRIVASSDRCGAWFEIEPRGWVCAKDLAPSDLSPEPSPNVDPKRIVDYVLAQRHLDVVADGTRVYETPSAIRNAQPTGKLARSTFLRGTIDAITVVGGIVFLRTVAGYVAMLDLMGRPPSTFEGVELTRTSQWPFAWVVPRTQLGVVRANPTRTGRHVRDLAQRAQVPILERRHGFARIGPDEWVALDDLRIAASSKRPGGVRADERWIDIDLDQQTLVAYDGDTPVYATLVSTGKGTSTPPSLHRIRKKLAMTRVKSPAIALGTWDLPEVPFYMDFRKDYAIHGAYWHDSFGTQRSHGCVNVSPRDGRRLFEWTIPHVPAGYQEADARSDEGTPVRIRSRAVPNPPWTDYDAPPPVPTRAVDEAT